VRESGDDHWGLSREEEEIGKEGSKIGARAMARMY
jgi:hypothetical protein